MIFCWLTVLTARKVAVLVGRMLLDEVRDDTGVFDGLGDAVGVYVNVGVGVLDGVNVAVGVWVWVGVLLGLSDGVAVGVLVDVAVGVCVGLGVIVGVEVVVGVAVALGVAVHRVAVAVLLRFSISWRMLVNSALIVAVIFCIRFSSATNVSATLRASITIASAVSVFIWAIWRGSSVFVARLMRLMLLLVLFDAISTTTSKTNNDTTPKTPITMILELL